MRPFLNRRLLPAAAALGLGLLLAACTSIPLPPLETPPPVAPAAAAEPPPPAAPSLERPRARWVAARFEDLPGWEADRLQAWWPAFLAGCVRPPAPWQAACAQARQLAATGLAGDEPALRRWLQGELRVWRVEGLEGQTEGLMTGYHEPLMAASRRASTQRKVPLHGVPADLASRRPWWTRQQIDTLPAAQAALKGREIAWLEDPLDALVLHIQGSGRLRVTEPDGSQRWVRLAFAGHNDQPYRSVGRWLIEQGELTLAEASWPGIKAWARRNPKRLQEMLWQNPRYVFFREEPLTDPTVGPRGAQGVPLTPGRSIAVDPLSIPYGTPVWLDTTEPLSPQPLRRLVQAQDTGSAITGAVRADYFWGWGEDAESQAGRTRQPLRAWVLWPRDQTP
ncbi:murein transglycosylase A [Ideonella livida]|uniref:peptidoglycan lytic exotransglycosylase n=1 Tax=Ideonella livida TaxID=2707176 RepID=A0A7C9PGJ8_9BURK|nr:MltA domain-containing protein [Ideonella livida]NDY90971.1 transglycosylase [Ideonella livida]